MKKYLTLLFAAMACCTGALAVPAIPGLIKATQPDGTEITIRLHGDENLSWASSPDGYTLLPDSQGFWTYARLAGDGVHAEASQLRFSDKTAAPAFARKAIAPAAGRHARVSRKAPNPLQIDQTFPTTGKRKLLMLLVNYSDTYPTFSQSDFHNYMNQRAYGGIGSFRDYYLEASYGQLDIETTVTRWITLPNPKSYYGYDGAIPMIRDAIALIDDEIDLKDFDNDGDGVLDGLAVIHQGAGAEASGDTSNDIWSHSGTVYGIEFDGVQLRRYTIEPEMLGNTKRMSTIGVMCHEFGHNLGAPDFYDTDYSLSGGEYPGTGVWDLMGGGAWNGDTGTRPAGINAWQKMQFGWIKPVLLQADTHVAGMKGASVKDEAYRINTTVPGEYFILENRTLEGPFDSALPGSGLIVYHISESRIIAGAQDNVLNASYPQAAYTVCAGAKADPAENSDSYGWVNTAHAPFPGEAGVTRFADNTLPSTHSIDGRFSYVAVSNIAQAADGSISFDFSTADAPASPRGLKATALRGEVSLSWQAPDADEAPALYNIYRNGALLASVTGTSFIDSETEGLSAIEYSVDAQYSSGLVSPYVATSVVLPVSRITSAEATVDADSVELTWDIDTRLTRITGSTEDFIMESKSAETLEIAQKFRADDLAIYRGYGLRRISFFPLQSQRTVSCKLVVYEAEPDSDELKVIAEREVSEFGTNTWNTKQLLRSIEITGEKDLYISVRFTSSNSLVQFLTDRGPALQGYGNLVSVNGAPLAPDASLSGNVFLYATLTEPSSREQLPLVAPSGKDDPAADSAFPIGFAVYRDGALAGKTSGRKFTDTAVPGGAHTYEISCIFKGGHESSTARVLASVGTDALTEVAAAGLSVRDLAGGVEIKAPAGQVSVTDLAGRGVATLHSDGEPVIVPLAPGFYIISAGANAVKVILP